MAKKRLSQDSIPDLIEQVLPVWQKEIERLQSLEAPSQQEILTSIKLAQVMTTTYITYRTLKETIKAETNKLTPEQLAAKVKMDWAPLLSKN